MKPVIEVHIDTKEVEVKLYWSNDVVIYLNEENDIIDKIRGQDTENGYTIRCMYAPN